MHDNAQCFTAFLIKEFTANQGIEWNTVLSYAPMWNGQAERMVHTVKASVSRIFQDHEKDWAKIIRRFVYGYSRRPLVSNCSPFELMYGVHHV